MHFIDNLNFGVFPHSEASEIMEVSMDLLEAVRILAIPRHPQSNAAGCLILGLCKNRAKIYIRKWHMETDIKFNDTEKEDIASEVFFKVLEHARGGTFSSMETASSVEAYITQMVHNRVADELSKIMQTKILHIIGKSEWEKFGPRKGDIRDMKLPPLEYLNGGDAIFYIGHFYDCLQQLARSSNEMHQRIQIFMAYYQFSTHASHPSSMDGIIQHYFHVSRDTQPEEWKRCQDRVSQWMSRVRKSLEKCFDEKMQKGQFHPEERADMQELLERLMKKQRSRPSESPDESV